MRQKWLDLASGNSLANLQACHKEALWGEWCLLKWTGIFSYFWSVCRDELQRRERSRKHFRWELIGLSTFSFTSNSRVNTEYTVTLMRSWASCVIFHSSKWPFERHGSALKAVKWLSIMCGYDHGLKCHTQVPQLQRVSSEVLKQTLHEDTSGPPFALQSQHPSYEGR